MWFAPRVEKIPDTRHRPPNTASARAIAGRVRRSTLGVARSRRGAHALEFAVVSTIAIPMLLVAAELALHSAVAVALDNAAYKASREGSLGRKNTDGTRAGQACQSAILSAARSAGRGLLNGDLRVSTRNYNSAEGATTDDPNNRTKGTKGAGLGGHTVVYELQYDQPAIFGGKLLMAGKLFGHDKHVHKAIVTIQNEPFSEGKKDAPACS